MNAGCTASWPLPCTCVEGVTGAASLVLVTGPIVAVLGTHLGTTVLSSPARQALAHTKHTVTVGGAVVGAPVDTAQHTGPLSRDPRQKPRPT